MQSSRRAARRLHRDQGFDLVHAWHARSWEAGCVIGRFCNLPVVATLHDHPEARFLGASRRRLMRWVANSGLKKLICVSEAVRHSCEESGYDHRRLTVIHNGLPDSPPAQPPDGSSFVLGFLGVFSERKGFLGLFEMLDHFASVTKTAWKIKIAGGGDESMLDAVRSRYARACWWPQVEFVGWTDSPMRFLAEVDLLIVPSTEFDPFPTVLLEAAQVSRPVLASNVGGVSEIVVHGVTGWIFDPSDWAGAADRLARLAEDPNRLSSAGSAAGKRVRENFSLKSMFEKHKQIYRMCRTEFEEERT
jgi:glycosyltransferase involved in cell wall biosynthesis